jgi:tRNA(adenine34) deaminase
MNDLALMQAALEQARAALKLDEVPVGCVVLHIPSDQIISAQHNRRQTLADPTAHAEILALREAAKSRETWRLDDCALAVTLEPCAMCAGALVNARIARVIYGCADPKAGAVQTLFQICDDSRLNHQMQITSGILADECSRLLSDFFRAQRALGKK